VLGSKPPHRGMAHPPAAFCPEREVNRKYLRSELLPPGIYSRGEFL
jgi:hypothetical protein